MGWNTKKESGHKKPIGVTTLVPILEGLEIVQMAAGERMTIFLTSTGEILEIGVFNRSGKPFLKHKIPEPIVKIVAGEYSFYALSFLGNVFSWRDNEYNQLGFPGGERNV